MLALAYASRFPETISAVVIIGCGTFDPASRDRMKAIVAERVDDNLRNCLDNVAWERLNPGEYKAARHRLMRPTEIYADLGVDEEDDVSEPFDLRAHNETWQDMMRLQDSGVYPQAFAAITSPVLILHGTYDPHPGHMNSGQPGPAHPSPGISGMGTLRTRAVE
jgi:pimeloyl-ACP methyl ester carboxylesterase